MGKKVPVPVENIAFERLDLSRHYLTVDCDATCFLVLNPSGEIPIEGTDICALHTGAWQIDAWKLLTKKDFPNQAGFVACLVWDKTLISDSVHVPACVESDIDTANSVSSLKGQPVNITGFSMAEGQALPVFSSPDNPIYTRFHPFYLPSIIKNVPLGSKFKPLMAIAREVVKMADGSYTLNLRPNFCRVPRNPGFCSVFPDHVAVFEATKSTAQSYDLLENYLVLRVGGTSPYPVQKIQYFLMGAPRTGASGTANSWGGQDMTQLDYLEF